MAYSQNSLGHIPGPVDPAANPLTGALLVARKLLISSFQPIRNRSGRADCLAKD